jgi:acyl carrier protein
MKVDSAYRSPDDIDRTFPVVARCFSAPRNQLTKKTLLVEDLGVDSIDLLALAIDLEKEFDVVIADEAFYRIRTIGDMILYMNGTVELRRIGCATTGTVEKPKT